MVALFADPDFGSSENKTTDSPIINYPDNKTRGKLRSGQFVRLEDTKTEAEAIINILQKKNVIYYSDDKASEANLLTVKQPLLFHIATHGFFSTDTQNPMLQSGLVLAGVNESQEGEGIVTALELAGLDLKGTDLVVLSACETGKVDPNNTDGVSGLTKAFIQAGAKDVVMTLWKVADKQTADLMKSFYQASKENKYHYSNALKQSKLAMIQKDLHPYYWAGFLLNGL